MKMHCRKWLVKGNHDKKSYTWYLTHGWDFVGDSIRLYIHGKYVHFSHIPNPNDYYLNVHGHLHNNDHREALDDRCILYSPELENYQPLTLQFLISRHMHKLKELEE